MASVNAMTNYDVDVHQIANDIYKQAMGSAAVSVVDTASFTDFGNATLSNASLAQAVLQTLLGRVKRTIDTYRPYTNKLADWGVSADVWGEIVQKINVVAPEFVTDDSWTLEDGDSPDMFKVRKPKVSQKLFTKMYTYKNYDTIFQYQLNGAFADEAGFARFVAMITGVMRNLLEQTDENFARLSQDAFLSTLGDSQVINLVTLYNNASGKTLTSANAMLDMDFRAYCASTINLMINRLSEQSVLYNSEGVLRHTPNSDQRLCLFDKFVEQLNTVPNFTDLTKKIDGTGRYAELGYWQGEGTAIDSADRMSIKVKDEEGEKKTYTNVVASLSDRRAFGYSRREEIYVTPLNARGAYYDRWIHLMGNIWADASENGIIFTLN